MAETLSLSLRNDLSELGRVAQLVEGFARQHRLSEKLVFDCNLALDEVLSNVISYAFTDGEEHTIGVRISVAATAVDIVVQDDGVPFNPLEIAVPDVTVPLDERAIGGLGIHFVRTLMSDLAYRREAGKNILTMVRRIDATR